jgi:serine/threonine-protein kinase SRPK3
MLRGWVDTLNKYQAVKILTLEGTHDHAAGHSRKLEFMQQIAVGEEIDALPFLEDYFEEIGPGGSHLCLVMMLLGQDVSSFRRSAPKKVLPVHVSKVIIQVMLEGLDQLHAMDIIHTGSSSVGHRLLYDADNTMRHRSQA